METQDNRSSYRDLLSILLTQVSNLVRGEIALAKAELRDKARASVSATVIVVVGITLGVFSAMSLIAAVIVALSPKIGPALACVLMGGILGAVALFLVTIGVREFGKVRGEVK
jgi:uncharacterized membrane protein YqjE